MADKLIVTGARGASATEVARRTGTFLGATVTPGMSDAEVMDAPISVINELVEAAGVTDQLAAVRTASSMDDGDIALAGEQSVGGVALVEGDRVLLTYQDAAAENGPWVVDAGAWTRPTDFDGAGEAPTGLLVQVDEGDNAGLWRLTTQGSNVIGTTGLTWRPFSLRSLSKFQFLQEGEDAHYEPAMDSIRRLGVYPQSFGATGLVSAADDTEAFNKATIAAQALGVPLIVPQGTYRVRMWTVPRAGGGLNIQVHPEAVIKLFGPLTGTDSVLEVHADNTTIKGGIWDGGAAANYTAIPGNNVVVKAFAGVSGDAQIKRFVFEPNIVRNGNAAGVFVLAAKDSHVRGGRFENMGTNCVYFVTGNSANPLYDADVEDCSIDGCVGDRTMNGNAAAQGVFKFNRFGADATARDILRCVIRNCIASMAEIAAYTNGEVVIEIWGDGTGSSIENCKTYGGSIGQSVANNQTFGKIIGGYARRATYICFELAASANSRIDAVVADCDNLSPIGVSLDHQGSDEAPNYNVSATGMTIHKPVEAAISVLGPATSPAGTWLASGTEISGFTIDIDPSRSGAIGIRVDSVQGVKIGGGLVDGRLAANFNVLVLNRVKGAFIDGIEIRNITNHFLQLNATGVVGDVMSNIHVGNVQTDGTGIAVQFLTSGGTFDSAGFSWGCYQGSTYLGVSNPGWSLLSPSGLGNSVLARGFCTGSPQGVVTAGVGSQIQRIDGGAGTSIYVKETGTGNTGWVGK